MPNLIAPTPQDLVMTGNRMLQESSRRNNPGSFGNSWNPTISPEKTPVHCINKNILEFSDISADIRCECPRIEGRRSGLCTNDLSRLCAERNKRAMWSAIIPDNMLLQ